MMDNYTHISVGSVTETYTSIYNTTQLPTDSGDNFNNPGGIQCSLNFSECDTARKLWMVLSPLILILGTVGNILIILIMSEKKLRKTAFGCYLISMSVFDLCAIWIGLSRHFIKNAYNIDIRKSHVSICWLQRILLYGSLNTSVWLLTAVTLERTLSIYAPTRSMKFKSLNRTKLVIALIILIQFSWNFHIFYTRGIEYVTEDGVTKTKICGYPNLQAKLFYEKNIQTYLAMIDYSLVPFLSMFIMNVAIFLRLRKRDKKYSNCATVSNGHSNVSHHAAKHSNVSNKTLMLLPVTIFFLVTTLPSLAFTGVETQMSLREDETELERARMEIADFAFTALLYLNHSLNFFLYCLTGKMFRNRCWAMLTKCCKSKDSDSWESGYTRSPITQHKGIGNSRNGSPYSTPPRSRSNTRTFSISGGNMLNVPDHTLHHTSNGSNSDS